MRNITVTLKTGNPLKLSDMRHQLSVDGLKCVCGAWDICPIHSCRADTACLAKLLSLPGSNMKQA